MLVWVGGFLPHPARVDVESWGVSVCIVLVIQPPPVGCVTHDVVIGCWLAYQGRE